jgi:hypothetical protein
VDGASWNVPLSFAYGVRLFICPWYVNLCPSHIIICLIYLLATSVDVEHIFSHGRLILSHVRSRLSAQSTRALICLGSWSLLGLVKDSDVMAVTVLPEVEEDEEPELEKGWDHINL